MDCICDDVLYARVGPLLAISAIRELRCINRQWLAAIDTLLPVKGALAINYESELTIAGYKYMHTYISPVFAGSYCTTYHDARDRLSWKWLYTFCEHGTFEDMCWAEQHMLSTPISESPYEYLETACDRNNAALAIQLIPMYQFTRDDDICALFISGGTTGNVAILQCLYQVYAKTIRQCKPQALYAFAMTCRNGHLEAAQWLLTALCIQQADVLQTLAFNYRCSGNTTTFNCLRWCIRGQHLSACQWIVSAFAITRLQMQSELRRMTANTECLMLMRETPPTAVMQWIEREFYNVYLDSAKK